MATMAKVKAHMVVSEKVTGRESHVTPVRRTRRQMISQVQEVSTSSTELEGEKADLRPASELSEQKVKSKPRRSTAVSSDASPKPQASDHAIPPTEPTAKRRGGNKRKHDHEYCLTCQNYGRACGGRREGIEGCAVCREPNKEKGEKLRECLWVDAENGIYTYTQARERLKSVQAETKAAKGKPTPKRPPPARNSQISWLQTPDPLGLVETRKDVDHGPPPPVSRALDLLPPPFGASSARVSLSDDQRNHILSDSNVQNDSNGRLLLNSPSFSRGSLQSQEPRVHKPEIIRLIGKDEIANVRANQFYSVSARRTLQQDEEELNTFRKPYFDPRLNAYVLPAYPHSNLLPPELRGRFAHQAYISPYDTIPSLLITTDISSLQQPVKYHSNLPPPNPNISIPRPVYTKPQPLDKTGKPARRWSKGNSQLTNLSGYELQTKGWKIDGHRKENRAEDEEEVDTVMGAVEADSTVISTTASSPIQQQSKSHEGSNDTSSERDHVMTDVIDVEDEARKPAGDSPIQKAFNDVFRQNAKRKRISDIDAASSDSETPIVVASKATKIQSTFGSTTKTPKPFAAREGKKESGATHLRKSIETSKAPSATANGVNRKHKSAEHTRVNANGTSSSTNDRSAVSRGLSSSTNGVLREVDMEVGRLELLGPP